MAHIRATHHKELGSRPKKRLLPTLDRRSVYQFEALLSGYNVEYMGIHEAQTRARHLLPRQRRLAEVFSD